MPERRLQKTRDSYRCGRTMVIVPWTHCPCDGCRYALEAPRRYGAIMDAVIADMHAQGFTLPDTLSWPKDDDAR